MNMIGGNFDLRDFHVVVVGRLDEDLFEHRSARLLENRMPVLGCPDQMVFQPRDMVLGMLQIHTVDSLAPSGPRYPSLGQAPAVSASLAETLLSSGHPKPNACFSL